jgi:hypothetical protein
MKEIALDGEPPGKLKHRVGLVLNRISDSLFFKIHIFGAAKTIIIREKQNEAHTPIKRQN